MCLWRQDIGVTFLNLLFKSRTWAVAFSILYCTRKKNLDIIPHFFKNVVMDGIMLSLLCPTIFQMVLRVCLLIRIISNGVLSESSASQRSQDFNSFPDSFDLPCLRWSERDYGASAVPPSAAWAWHCVLFPLRFPSPWAWRASLASSSSSFLFSSTNTAAAPNSVWKVSLCR